MALNKCPECGREVSDSAKMCPNCGCTLKKSVAIPLLLGVACVFSVLLAAFFLPSFLNPQGVKQAVVYRMPYLVALTIAGVSLAAAVLHLANIKIKNKTLAVIGIILSIACFALLAYGFTLTTEFFLLVPFVLASPILSLIAGCLSLKRL